MTELDDAKCIDIARNPKPGDYWHEMFLPVLLVIDRIDKHVVIYDKVKKSDAGWQWDVEEPSMISVDDLVERVTYDTMSNKTWCNPCRGSMREYVDYWNTRHQPTERSDE